MNRLELRMVDLLVELRDRFHVVGVKAEFEAEGTRMEEAMRLKEISMRAGLDLTIKIGGCEALKDMFEAASLGTRNLVAPMVETPYALRKYLQAVTIAFPEDLRANMDFYVNIETITAVESFDRMLEVPEIDLLSGIVIGRHDLASSMALPESEINGDRVFQLCVEVAEKAKAADLLVVVGGAVSVISRPLFLRFPSGTLDKFETRKVVFGCPLALDNPDEAFLKAVEFEILWLKNKNAYYGSIGKQGEARLAVMETRYAASIELMNRQRAE